MLKSGTLGMLGILGAVRVSPSCGCFFAIFLAQINHLLFSVILVIMIIPLLVTEEYIKNKPKVTLLLLRQSIKTLKHYLSQYRNGCTFNYYPVASVFILKYINTMVQLEFRPQSLDFMLQWHLLMENCEKYKGFQ